jgi:perosamine synthetase
LLTAALSQIEGLALQRVQEDSLHSFHQYCFTVEPSRLGLDRDTLRERLQQSGVVTGVHYPLGLHEQPVFQQLYGNLALPVTEDARRRIMAIPVHHGLSEEDVAYIISAIKGSTKR